MRRHYLSLWPGLVIGIGGQALLKAGADPVHQRHAHRGDEHAAQGRAGHGGDILVRQAGVQQLADYEGHAAGRLEGVHVLGAVRIDPGDQRGDAGEVVEVLPGELEARRAAHGETGSYENLSMPPVALDHEAIEDKELAEAAKAAFASLRSSKLRSFLTLFGIAWGIASLVLLSALSDGFRQGQRKNMAQIGDNLVFVWGGTTERQAGGQRAGRRIRLDADDYFLDGRLGRLLSAPRTWDLIADDIVMVRGREAASAAGLVTGPGRPQRLTLATFVTGNIARPGASRRELGFLKPIMRRGFLDRQGLRYDPRLRLGEDYALYVEALAAGAVFGKIAGASAAQRAKVR